MPMIFLFIFLALAGAWATFAHSQSDPQLCQSQLKIEQDATRYAKELSAQLLTRVEKAEEEMKALRQKLEEAQKPKE